MENKEKMVSFHRKARKNKIPSNTMLKIKRQKKILDPSQKQTANTQMKQIEAIQ